MKASLLQDWLFCRDITSVICPFVKDYPVVSAVNPLDASLFYHIPYSYHSCETEEIQL